LQFLGDVSALYSAIHTAIAVLLIYGLKIGMLYDNHLLNAIFKLKKKFKYPGFCSEKVLKKVGLRRIDKELDIEEFIKK
jgi:hypothetical protein